mmetsp:Transcript_33537/g.69796  ORF Transcript_33537/g.69796 Transcript_33537/m.69796 type:complete len:201 (-) Transcript_33537:39-641(-)
MSQAAEAFENDGNGSLATAMASTANVVEQVTTELTALERYITLTIPQMEDGNNFGVTIQLAVLKQITEAREKNDSAMEELMKYSSSRADALEKCKLPSVSISETETVSESNSQENTEEKSSKSTAKETKTIKSKTEPSPALAARQQAVVAVDVLYYSKAKTAYSRAVTAYLTVLDFYDKNQKKISQPKGTQGSSSYHSMY